MSVNFNTDQLLCMVVVDDNLAVQVMGPENKPEHGWIRGWVLQNRATREIWATYRFCYKGGDRSWYEIHPGEQNDLTETRLRCGLEDVFKTAGKRFGLEVVVECFYPPNRGENLQETINFLVENDLVEVRKETNDDAHTV
jgi:hypothetical protein